MKTDSYLFRQYELMVRLLEEGELCVDAGFAGVCRSLGVAPEELERLIYSETGMTGEQILELYR